MPFEVPRRSYLLPTGADVASLVSSLAAQLDGTGLTVADDRPRRLDATFLDTADRRLRAGGGELRLERPHGRGEAGQLVLYQHPGEQNGGQPWALGRHESNPPPAGDGSVAPRYLIDDLPPGALRDRLAPIVGVRALLPLARVTMKVHPLRILNRDDKTVARLALTTATAVAEGNPAAVPLARQTIAPPAEGAADAPPAQRATPLTAGTARAPEAAADALLAARAELTGVLGYDKPFRRLRRLLGDELGWVEATTGWADDAVAALGGDPAGIPTKLRTWLSPDQRTDEAAVAVLSGLADLVEANLPGTLDDLDSEFLHDLRVAVRRSRSVLRELRRAFPPGALAEQREALRWIQQITGPTRDHDVQLLDEGGFLAPVADGGHDALAPLRKLLTRQRAAAFRRLRRQLRSDMFARRWSAYRSFLTSVTANQSEVAGDRDSSTTGAAAGESTTTTAAADEEQPDTPTDADEERPDTPGSDADEERPDTPTDADEERPDTPTDADEERPDTPTDADEERPDTPTDAEEERPDTPTDADEERPDTPTDADEERPDAGRPIVEVAGRRIRRVYRRMVEMGSAIDDTSPPEALHELRKRGKELRYLLELFGGLWPADTVRPMVRRLKGLQDVLGAHQDREVQAAQLRSLAGELATVDGGPEALLALGVVVDRLGDAQRASRAAFADQFARFADADQQRLVDGTFRRRR